MATVDPESNVRYASADDLHPLAWEELSRRSPEEAGEAAGAGWDGRVFHLPVIGRPLLVDPEARQVVFPGVPGKVVGYQRALVAVTCLSRSLAVDPRGDWVSFRELPGGDGFFRGPHSLDTPRLERHFGAEPRHLVEAATALGGHRCEGADVAAELPALPRVPVRVLIWSGSDEFAPAASLLTDPRAHLHLPLDVLWALTNVLVADLVRRVN